jgi:hypothetical protein
VSHVIVAATAVGRQDDVAYALDRNELTVEVMVSPLFFHTREMRKVKP